MFRLLSCITAVAVVGAAAPASAQVRAWQQGARTAAVRPTPTARPQAQASVGQPTPAATPNSAAPQTVAVPQPAASPWLPTTGPAPAPAASSRRTAQNVGQLPAAAASGRYPLPGVTVAPQPNFPAAAVLRPPQAAGPSAPSAAVAPYAVSPYAAAYMASQSPTPAPPLTGPTNGGPSTGSSIANESSPWQPPTAAPTWSTSSTVFGPTPSPAASLTPESGSFTSMGSSCDPAEMLDPAMTFEDPGDPMIETVAPRGCGPWFFSVSGLILSRGVPNNVALTSTVADPGASVLSTERVGTDDWLGGVEFRLGRMVADRWAVEFGYWSLQAQDETAVVRDLNNGLNSNLDFENVSYQGTPLNSVFDNSREQRFYRTWNVESMEINLLQQALVVDPIDRWGMSMFTGVRYLRFDEWWHYDAAAANSEFADNNPDTQSNYWIRLKNRMVGWQLGGRGHVRLGSRVRLFAMPRFAVLGTRIGQQQHVCMIIDQHSNKTDVALLGQLDLGMSVQVFPCFSVFGSYRAMGISGVAVGDDNVARSMANTAGFESINSSSALILHGWQIGAQYQF